MRRVFVGIDYSMQSPAMCIDTGERLDFLNLNGRKKLHGTYEISGIVSVLISSVPEGFTDDIQRYAMISKPFIDFILEKTNEDDEVNVSIEGYSYGSKGGNSYNIAENCQTLKLRLYNEPRVRLLLPSPAPTSIKKFATGKGNADKEMMGERFLTLTGLDFSKKLYDASWGASPVSDLVDAFWICQYAKQHDKTENQDNQR